MRTGKRSAPRHSFHMGELHRLKIKKTRAKRQRLDQLCVHTYTYRNMAEPMRKVTVNLPARALESAMRITGKGVTPTLAEGLAEIEKRAKRSALRALKGKIRFELVLDETRR